MLKLSQWPVAAQCAFFSCATLILGASLFATAARAENCRCDRYLELVPQYSLAENVAAIGAAALHQEGRIFSADAEVADALIRKIKDDRRIPAECRDFVASSIHVGSRASVVIDIGVGGAPPGFSMDGSTASNLWNLYAGLISSFNPCSKPDSKASSDVINAYIGCLKTNSPNAFKNATQTLANGNTQSLTSLYNSLGASPTSADIAMLKAYSAALNSGTEAGLKAWASAASKQLTTDQFINVVRAVGYELNNSYSYARANGTGTAGNGIITVDQALASIKTNSMFMINGSSDVAASIGDFKIVCRDAAVVQVVMLNAGGIKAHEVGYTDSSGGHTDVNAQDPHDRLKSYTINWWGRADHESLDGAQLLFQGGGMGIPDYGLSYTISGTPTSARNIGNVPSEMGKFLAQASGGDIRSWDPLARSTGSMIAISGSPDPKGYLQYHVLDGTDGNGANYAGGAMSLQWGAGTNFPGHAGGFAGQMFRPAGAYGESQNGTAILAYGEVEQHVITPKLQISPNVTAVADAHAILNMDMSHITSGPDFNTTNNSENINSDYNHRIGYEIRVDQKAMDGKLNAQYVAGGYVMFGTGDVRDDQLASTQIIPLDAYLGARATLDEGGVKLFGDAMLVASQLGVRDRVEVGVASRKVAAAVFESGDVTNDSSLIEEGAVRRVGVTVSASPNKHIRLNLTGEIPVEGDDPVAGLRVFGSAALVY